MTDETTRYASRQDMEAQLEGVWGDMIEEDEHSAVIDQLIAEARERGLGGWSDDWSTVIAEATPERVCDWLAGNQVRITP